MLNATELYTLKWQILCYVYFTIIKIEYKMLFHLSETQISPVPCSLLNLATLVPAGAKTMPGGFPHGAGATEEKQLLLLVEERDRK